MKICKIKITKKLIGNRCDNIYPAGYNPQKINVVAYDEEPLDEGDNVGYCIGLVEDDFSFTDDMVETDKATADTFIDDRASIIEDAELKANFTAQRKQSIADAGII